MAKEGAGLAEIEEYTKKLNQNPESLVFVPLAETYRKNGMLDESIDVCIRGLKHHPTYMSAHVCLGRAYMEKGLMQEAQEEFSKVIEFEPNNIMARSSLANIYMLQGQYDQVIQECEHLLSINPDNQNIQVLMDEAKRYLEQYSPASIPRKPEPPPTVKKTDDIHPDRIRPAIKEDNVKETNKKDLEVDAASGIDAGPMKKESMSESVIKPKVTLPQPILIQEPEMITGDDLLSAMKDIVGGLIFDKGEKREAQPASKNTAPTSDTLSSADHEQEKEAHVNHEPTVNVAKAIDSNLEVILHELNKRSGILGSMIITSNGELVANALKGGMDEKGAGAAGVLLFKKTAEASSRMQWGNVGLIILSAEASQIILVETKKGILNVLADINATFGLLKIALNETVRKINM